MLPLCNKLSEMLKDEKEGAKTYKDIQLDMLKSGLIKKGTENYIYILNSIEEDENRHKREINKMMKEIGCK